MLSPGDLFNGLFEMIGGAMVWLNVARIMRDKQTRGVNWQVSGFFTVWGFWNLWYYPSLHQWISFVGGAVIVMANCWWCYFAIKYRKN